MDALLQQGTIERWVWTLGLVGLFVSIGTSLVVRSRVGLYLACMFVSLTTPLLLFAVAGLEDNYRPWATVGVLVAWSAATIVIAALAASGFRTAASEFQS